MLLSCPLCTCWVLGGSKLVWYPTWAVVVLQELSSSVPQRSGPSLSALSKDHLSMGNLSSAGASPLARQGSNLKRQISMKRNEQRNSSLGNKHTLSLKVSSVTVCV